MEDLMEIAAISNDTNVILFNAVGIRTYFAKDLNEVDKIIFQLVNKKCKIIYVNEDIYEQIPETILKYKSMSFPIILPIPMKEESHQVGLNKIQDNVEKAIGINIFEKG